MDRRGSQVGLVEAVAVLVPMDQTLRQRAQGG
jgi:hypothetical protein